MKKVAVQMGLLRKTLSAIWITGLRGSQSTMQNESKRYGDSLRNVNDKCEYESSEGCVLLGEEGGKTRNERVEEKKIDGAKQNGRLVRENTNKDK